MRWYRDSGGTQRLWLDSDEIEMIIEDELRKAGLFPAADQPVVDIERFIEGHLRAALDQYADLEPRVLGMTEFRPARAPKISINRDLTGSALDEEEGPPGAAGRCRATLAHEAAHVVFHRALFELDPRQETLIASGPDAPDDPPHLMRCLKRAVSFSRPAADWREVQANRGMAALLMPRAVFAQVARQEAESLGVRPGHLDAGSSEARVLSGGLASRFAVSRQAARIRLEGLGLVVPEGQGQLGL